MNLKLTSGTDTEGKKQYYILGLDAYESFDQVIDEILKFGWIIDRQVDGIYSRSATLRLAEREFKIIYHEDVGVYASSALDFEDDHWLEEVLMSIVKILNNAEDA